MRALHLALAALLAAAFLPVAIPGRAQPAFEEVPQGTFPAATQPVPLPAGAPDDGIRVVVDSPRSGSAVEARTHMVEILGTAIAAGDRPQHFDVMLVLDVSQSTRQASGADVDGDGEIGEDPHLGLYAPGEFPDDVYSTDPEDTVLAAEVSAARALLASLTASRTRVGLITFSGEVDPETGKPRGNGKSDATLQVPLTSDFAQVDAALDAVLARGPHGGTNFAAGIRLATTELANIGGAVSEPRPESKKVMLFLTDGRPSLPFGSARAEDPGDLEAAVNAARVAHSAGIRINTYAIGSSAVAQPVGATEVARVTLGTFTPVVEPGAIVAALQSVNFANVEDVAIVNLTLRESTPDIHLNPDGSFQGFVPVQEGANRVLVNAIASDGTEANVELSFDFQVEKSKGAELEKELARLRQLNDELIRHMEAEKIRRERRQRRIEKELEIRPVAPEGE